MTTQALSPTRHLLPYCHPHRQPPSCPYVVFSSHCFDLTPNVWALIVYLCELNKWKIANYSFAPTLSQFASLYMQFWGRRFDNELSSIDVRHEKTEWRSMGWSSVRCDVMQSAYVMLATQSDDVTLFMRRRRCWHRLVMGWSMRCSQSSSRNSSSQQYGNMMAAQNSMTNWWRHNCML